MSETGLKTKQVALIADDDPTNLMVLSKFLSKLGYDVINAKDGKEAVEQFTAHEPDIVFMDVMMPVMDGYEATTQIKKLCNEGFETQLFVPVIFLTALNSAEDLVKCVEAGGDDFLSKPLELTILRAKIHAIERIQNVYRQVQSLNTTLKDANKITNKIFQEAVFNENLKNNAINTWFKSSEEFNNDLFLTAQTPAHGINILFGHFNVTGLTSAVGAIPTSEVFRTMTEKGFAPHNIVQRINAKLYHLLPDEISLSMIFININAALNQALICNFNMPEVQFINQADNKITYQHPAKIDSIGSTPRYSRDIELKRIDINENTRIIMNTASLYSDRKTEKNQENENQDENYTKEDFIAAIHEGISNNEILNTIKNSLVKFASHHDRKHVSIIEIPCDASLISQQETENNDTAKKSSKGNALLDAKTEKNTVEFSLHFSGKNIKKMDPVPTLLHNIESITNIDKQRQKLFTILTELYTNALDHGILKLDSALKKSAEGFSHFYQLKEQRLHSLDQGHIKINITLSLNDKQNQLSVSLEDSGDGFDASKLNNKEPEKNEYSGRGIRLLKQLCESVEFNKKGNKIDVLYIW